MINTIEKPYDFSFLEKYEKAKQEIRKRKEFIDNIEGIENSPGRKHLREIEVITEAFQEVV